MTHWSGVVSGPYPYYLVTWVGLETWDAAVPSCWCPVVGWEAWVDPARSPVPTPSLVAVDGAVLQVLVAAENLDLLSMTDNKQQYYYLIHTCIYMPHILGQ